MAYQITCITKPHPHSPVEHITHVGGVDERGSSFYWPRETVIANIKAGREFFVQVGSYKVKVEVENRLGVEYIKTRPDATTKDNLLSLRPC